MYNTYFSNVYNQHGIYVFTFRPRTKSANERNEPIINFAANYPDVIQTRIMNATNKLSTREITIRQIRIRQLRPDTRVFRLGGFFSHHFRQFPKGENRLISSANYDCKNGDFEKSRTIECEKRSVSHAARTEPNDNVIASRNNM